LVCQNNNINKLIIPINKAVELKNIKYEEYPEIFKESDNIDELFKDKETMKGDENAKGGNYGNIIAVRCIESKDARTAEITEVPYNVLKKIVRRITTEVPGVIKVVYDVTPKPPSTIEYI